MANLIYKIIGRRPIDSSSAPSGPGVIGPLDPIDAVDVEWTQANGEPFPDHKLMIETVVSPVTLELEKREIKVALPGRPVIKDQINVKKGSPDSLVMQVCEDKRYRLAANLGVEP